MSFGSALDFEMFNLGDIWKGIKKDPKRLLLGVDPWSTKAWNSVLGRSDEPLVDQMGGPYGGHVVSAFNNKDGGVYKRAQDAGIDTGTAGGIHDAAHVVAAMMAGNYGMGQLSGGSGASQPGQQQGWQQHIPKQMPQMGGQRQPPQDARDSIIRALLEAELKKSIAPPPIKPVEPFGSY